MSEFGITAEQAGARLSAALGPCRHEMQVPVDLVVTGEVVANICAGCHCRLPVDWSGEVVEIRTLGQREPIAYVPTF